MIFLLGVEHRVQWRTPKAIVPQTRKDNWGVYSRLIEEAIRNQALSVVAEEYNQEPLRVHNNAESILRSIKLSVERESGKCIKHVFAEPCKAEKRTIGYKEDLAVKGILKENRGLDPSSELVRAHMAAHQFPTREGFWLNKIKDYLDNDILFVCGDAHIDTFPLLLDKNSVAHKVLKRGIGSDGTELPESKGVKYARELRLFGTSDCPCQD